jgi:hypothetical protein
MMERKTNLPGYLRIYMLSDIPAKKESSDMTFNCWGTLSLNIFFNVLKKII